MNGATAHISSTQLSRATAWALLLLFTAFGIGLVLLISLRLSDWVFFFFLGSAFGVLTSIWILAWVEWVDRRLTRPARDARSK